MAVLRRGRQIKRWSLRFGDDQFFIFWKSSILPQHIFQTRSVAILNIKAPQNVERWHVTRGIDRKLLELMNAPLDIFASLIWNRKYRIVTKPTFSLNEVSLSDSLQLGAAKFTLTISIRYNCEEQIVALAPCAHLPKWLQEWSQVCRKTLNWCQLGLEAATEEELGSVHIGEACGAFPQHNLVEEQLLDGGQ